MAVGLACSMAGGILLVKHLQAQALDEFHRVAGEIFSSVTVDLTEYDKLVNEAYNFCNQGMITKGRCKRYLGNLSFSHYVGLDDIQLLKPDAYPPDSFCKEWINVERDTSMVWHKPLSGSVKQGMPKQQACYGALELRFNVETLFTQLFRLATDQGMGIHLDFYQANRTTSGGNHDKSGIFVKGVEENGNASWVKETDFKFFNNRLHATLSAPANSWKLIWPGLILALIGSLLSWAYYLRARRLYERNLQKYGYHLVQQQRGEEVDFIAHELAHELAQPLTGISGCLEGLMQRLNNNDLPPEVLVRDLTAASQLAQRACEFLDEIRSQTGLAGPGQRQSRPVAAYDVFRSVAALTKLDPRFHGISLAVKVGGTDCQIMVSRAALEIVLLNLLRNAAEAIAAEAIFDTVKGGVINMEAKLEDQWVKLMVIDDGPGLSRPEDLFRPYRSTKPNGMGIGLVLCKRLLERFGGSITGGNRPEGGSWFEIALPACIAEDAPGG